MANSDRRKHASAERREKKAPTTMHTSKLHKRRFSANVIRSLAESIRKLLWKSNVFWLDVNGVHWMHNSPANAMATMCLIARFNLTWDIANIWPSVCAEFVAIRLVRTVGLCEPFAGSQRKHHECMIHECLAICRAQRTPVNAHRWCGHNAIVCVRVYVYGEMWPHCAHT